jgi:alanine racemase
MSRSDATLLRDPAAQGEEARGTLRSLVPPSIPPLYVEVDLDAVVANAGEVRALVGPSCGVLAVLKADAYGHGLLPVARALERAGSIAGIVVSSVRDALSLRRAGIVLPIITLSCRYAGRHGRLIDAGITAVLGNLADLEALAAAARARGARAQAHVDLDTGMSRSGLREADIGPFLDALADHPEVVVSGLCTQLTSADAEQPTSAHHQLDAFERACWRFQAAGHRLTMVHAANTAAMARLPRSHFTHVRVGIALYGGDAPSGLELRPAMRVTTRVAMLRAIEAGESVGYGETWRAERPSLIATLPVGYAHGYPRRWSGPAEVLVRGHRCPVVGSICMEMTMVDVTDLAEVAIDDEVVLVGDCRGAEIRVTELALAMDGIVEEFLCAVPRAALRTYTGPVT